MPCNPRTSCEKPAIYGDDGSSGTLVEGNVVYHPNPGFAPVHGGRADLLLPAWARVAAPTADKEAASPKRTAAKSARMGLRSSVQRRMDYGRTCRMLKFRFCSET